MSPAFRDLNHNGTMEPYEDPGRTPAERAEDLLGRMTLEEKAGQLFHPMITPGPDGSVTAAPDSLAPEDPADVRIAGRLVSHFNVMQLRSARDAALWHNRLQELAAGTRLGIPVTLSSDPRHTARFVPGATVRADEFSRWPEPAGFAAIGDPGTVERFADIARREYRAVGISVALHPQADLATEPRWARVSATFGEDADLAARLVAAYVRGLQGEVLGPDSVAAMVKHFPGGGPQKDGDDPHFAYGREQVYPGGNFDYHLRPFQAAFAAGASQVMPSYGVPVGTKYAEEGFAFNREIITGLLRGECGFDGIVCTDWGLVTDSEIAGWPFPARAWGAERLSREERVLKILDAGADQFGGEECPEIVVALVNSGKLSQERLDDSVRRVLREKFRLGLFDQPFVAAEAAVAIVGTPEFRAAGLAAQRASLTLLKNDAGGRPVLPLPAGTKVYLSGVSPRLAAEYAEVTDDPAAADVAVVRLDQPPETGGRGSFEQRFHGGTLDFPADAVEAFAALASRLPTVAVVRLERPLVLPPIAAAAAALVGDFGASDRALLDVLFGRAEPKGRLPFDLPSSMREVLDQKPDVPFDMPNPAYRFGFGLGYPASHPSPDPRPQGNDN